MQQGSAAERTGNIDERNNENRCDDSTEKG